MSLDLAFPDAPALADLDGLNIQNTGFDFSPPGPERDHAIGEAEWKLQHYPTLQALWASTPCAAPSHCPVQTDHPSAAPHPDTDAVVTSGYQVWR
ncbi:hypothetical protein [Micromonospora sp. NPDC005413]|uniref:hypothetical protein n=1 Tax=Micromonospora sp. NPDC005413 TaxID=3154563 RepID=UPI0033A2B915